MIRVLVADDSVTCRQLLVEILSGDPDIRVVGEASDGLEAIELTKKLAPTLITMDIQMPNMDGFEATRRIMVETPTPIVIVSGSRNVHEVETSMDALRAGALTVQAKPPPPLSRDFDEAVHQFLVTIKAMAQVKVVRRWPERVHGVSPPTPAPKVATPPGIVAIAASTGGPAALVRILADIPAGFRVPVLVVQHIGRGFVEGLASWLNATAPLRVKVAEHGEPLRAGTVYVAPDDQHMGVCGQSAIALHSDAAIDGFRPSATFMFDSIARSFGRSTLALILTGMGSDGVAGLRSVHEAGGWVIAQDERSSAVFGMPAAAIAEGLADTILSVDEMATRLREMVGSEES